MCSPPRGTHSPCLPLINDPIVREAMEEAMEGRATRMLVGVKVLRLGNTLMG
jgi:hypothetical protein